MLKILALALILFSLSGCGEREPTVCPQIKPINKVAPISITAYLSPTESGSEMCIRLEPSENNSSICGKDAHKLFEWMKMMRKSDNYYREQVTEYNAEFTNVLP